MKRENIDSLIWIFCIVVLLLIGLRLYSKSLDADCNNCTATFRDKDFYEDKITEKFTVKITDLFQEYYKNGTCLIYWDPTNGYGGNYEQFK